MLCFFSSSSSSSVTASRTVAPVISAAAAKLLPLLLSSKPYSQIDPQSPQPPSLETLLSDILDSNPLAFTRDFAAPDSLKPLIADRDLFLSALDSVRRRPRLALRFFRWAERQPGFDRSEIAFLAVLEILADGGLMRAAYSVAHRAFRLRLLHGVVDLLIDGYVGSDAVTAKLLDLLLWMYTKCSMVEQALSTFYKMVAHGFLPDVKNCNRVLRILRDKEQWMDVRAVYREMLEVGIRPTIVTYNTMLDSFCKEGKAEEALKLLGDMEMKGAAFLPNDITYNVVINGLSKKGELDKAEKLLDKMRSSGKASAFTYNPLVNGLPRKGYIDEALGVKDGMAERSMMPTMRLQCYNLWII